MRKNPLRFPRRLLPAILILLAASQALAQPAPASAPASRPDKPGNTRTREQVEALIEQMGKTKPDWFDATELKYPDTLDLTWSNMDEKTGWEPQKKLGAYLFSVIGENPPRYKEGVKLLHQVVLVNKDNSQRLARSMDALGTAYYDLLEDYPRAVYWWRKVDKLAPGKYYNRLQYARSYFKMGNKQMALELVGRLGRDNTRNASIARLWSEMGETQRAITLAEGIAREGRPDVGYLAAGDVCRESPDFKRAMTYYQKVLAVTQTTGRDLDRNKQRAQRNFDGIRIIEALDLSKVKDGAYTGSELGYVNDIGVEVVIKAGRIESVKVSQTQENRPLTAQTDIPRQIVDKQGLKGVDVTSGATITSDAIINAAGKALQDAMK